jgi:hypothetical protein
LCGFVRKSIKDELPKSHLNLDSLLKVPEHIWALNRGPAPYFARAERDKKFGCLDTNGKEKIPFIYDGLGFWGDGRIAVNTGGIKSNEFMSEGGRWGYCNEKGKLVIPQLYEKAETFHEGLAAVMLHGRWGIIDTLGKMVVAPAYDEIGSFSEGLCGVLKEDHWGYINRQGEIVIPFRFGVVNEFINGVAVVRSGAYSDMIGANGQYYMLINIKGERLTPQNFNMIGLYRNGLIKAELRDTADYPNTKSGFLDRAGRIRVAFKYDDAGDMSDGLALVSVREKKNKKDYYLPDRFLYGYVDVSGREVIPPQFKVAGWFFNGMAVVSNESRSSGIEGYYINYGNEPMDALIDKSGRYILGYNWHNLRPIAPGLFLATRAHYRDWGLINIKGDTLIPFEYARLEYAGQGLFIAAKKSGDPWLLIDQHNKVLARLDSRLDIEIPRLQHGLLRTRHFVTHNFGFINRTGKPVVPNRYQMIYYFEPSRPVPWNRDHINAE